MNSKKILGGALLLAVACHGPEPSPLLRGNTYTGWRGPVGADAAHWTLRDGRLSCEGPAGPIWTEKEYGDCEITLDVRLIEGRPTAVLRARGERGFQLELEPKPTGEWSHIQARFVGDNMDVDVDGQPSAGRLPDVERVGAIGLAVEGSGSLELARIGVRKLP
ncbi:MAG TPA: hypothetical protein VM509_16275 [Planctomycetota bacterium]|nr:hypothetical protein [Planctomycetota bacterium]